MENPKQYQLIGVFSYKVNMKIKTFFAAIFAVLAVSCFAATDTIDELEIQSGIRFPDGSYQTSAYTGGETSEIQNLWFSLATLQTNLSFISNNFINANGSVPMAANLNMGGNSVTNVRSFQNDGVSVGFQEGAEVVEIVGDLYIDGAGSELNFTDRGDGKRELRLGYGLELLDGNIDMGGNSITNIGSSSNAIGFANGTYFGALSVSNWNWAYLYLLTNATPSNVWTKSDIVTNAIAMDGSVSNSQIAPDAVTAQSIAQNAVGNDEIANGAVTLAKLTPGIKGTDLGVINATSLYVKGLLNLALPGITVGAYNKTLGLDGSGNWQWRASSSGDMMAEDYAKTNAANNAVDKALFAERTSNTTGILYFPIVTNGRADNAVIVFSSGESRYKHISLADLGGGDMFKSTFATNSVNDPSSFAGYVDKSIISITSDFSRTSTNAMGIWGARIYTNDVRENSSVIAYNLASNWYYHVKIADLGGGDMFSGTYANDETQPGKVNQIANNVITSNNIVNGSVATDDLKNFSVTPLKTSNIVSYTTSFASVSSDLDGTYNTLTVEKIQGTPINFGEKTVNHFLGFAVDGSITTRVDSAITATHTPHVLDIDGASSTVSFGLSNKYYYLNITNTTTNWIITAPSFGDGAIYKLDVEYTNSDTFMWGGDLAVCTNLPTPPPTGLSSYIFEWIRGATNFVAYP